VVERGGATEDEVIHAFLLAEIGSNRCANPLKAVLAELGLDQSLIDRPILNEVEESRRRRHVLECFGRRHDRPVGVVCRKPPLRWRTVEFQCSDFETIYYIDHPSWRELSGISGLVSDGARNYRRYSSDKRFKHVTDICNAIRDGERFPPLILEDRGGLLTLTLVEGNSRATAYAIESFSEPVRAYVGSLPGTS